MNQVSEKVSEQIDRRFKGKGKVGQAARKLDVSRAALYNYIRKKNVPGIDVLERLNAMWGLEFSYGVMKLDREFFRSQREGMESKGAQSAAHQYVLPFIEGLRERDIEILQVTARKPSSVEVRFRIRFAG